MYFDFGKGISGNVKPLFSFRFKLNAIREISSSLLSELKEILFFKFIIVFFFFKLRFLYEDIILP